MASTALLSTVVMSGLLLVVLALVLRARRWQHPTPSVASVDTATVARRVNGPLGWSVAFFLGTLLVMGLGILYAGGEPVSGVEPATIGLALAASLALVIGVAAAVAVYGASRSRGLNSAQAAAVSSTFLFTLFLIAIVVQLFVGG